VALGLALLVNSPVPLKGAFRVIYYLPSILTGVAVAYVWKWIYNPEYGILNHFLGLVDIQGPAWLHSRAWAMPALILMSAWNCGGGMIIFLAGLKNIPNFLYESALIDGAGDDARELCEHLASYLGRRSAGLTRDPAAGRSPMLAVGA